MKNAEKPLFFKTPEIFRKWLKVNHNKKTEIWVGFYKKSSGRGGINYDQALDEALCFGWIDGLVNKHDEFSYMQRFTPRRKKSMWSKVNKLHVERLIKEGRMTSAGQAAIDGAKADGRWEAAYDPPSRIKIPEEFMKLISQDKKVNEFYNKLNKANIYAIGYRLQNAKNSETKEKRMKNIFAMLARGEKFH